MARRLHQAAWIGVAAAVIAFTAPSGEGRTQAVPATRISVKITTRVCKLSRKRVTAGKLVFALTNRSKVVHSLRLAGRRSRNVKPRRKQTFKVTINRPGRYPYLCKPGRGRVTKAKRGTLVVVKAGTTQPPPSPNPPPPPSGGPPPPVGPPPPPPPPPPHRLGVRNVGGFDEFYDRQTGLTFVPRGSVFVRRRLNETPTHTFVFSSSTFVVGAYSAAAAETALETMSADGYNVVRVFLDVTCRSGCLSDPVSPDGLSRPYLANLADFLRRAKANGIYVLIAAEALPYGSTYEALANTNRGTTFDRENVIYLTANGAEGNRRFWIALIQALRSVGAPLDDVWGYEPVAEQFYRDTSPPLTFGTGLVSTGNGQTYDMAVAGQKQLMMDENLVWWAGRVRSAILSVDPTALVGMGFLWPKGPNPARTGDPRVTRAKPLIDSSSLDFVDLHLQPGVELTFPQYMENYELTSPAVKPVVLGEFGAYQFAYPTVTDAERVLKSVEADSCPYGFDGWLHWSWDTTEYDTGENPLWSGADSSGFIDLGLGPLLRPDPCAPVPGAGNLALGKPVTASAELTPATRAVDGLMANSWSSGNYPPQWIEIDLGAPYSIARFRLFVTQTPDGSTTHVIQTRATTLDPWTDQYTFSDLTADNQVLNWVPPSPLTNVRYVRVMTTAGVSWVAWKEIEVFAP